MDAQGLGLCHSQDEHHNPQDYRSVPFNLVLLCTKRLRLCYHVCNRVHDWTAY